MARTRRFISLALYVMLVVCMFCVAVPKALAATETTAQAPTDTNITPASDNLFGRCPLFDRVVGEQMLSGEISANEAFSMLDSHNCPIIRGAGIISPQQLQKAVDENVGKQQQLMGGNAVQNGSTADEHSTCRDTFDCQRLGELTELMWSGKGSGSPKEVMDELVANRCPLLTSCAQFNEVKEKYTSGQFPPSKALELLMQECPVFSPTVPKPMRRRTPAQPRNAQQPPPGQSMADECIRLSDMLYKVDESDPGVATGEKQKTAEQAMEQLCDTKVPLINNCPLYQGVKARYRSGEITARMAVAEMKANCPILSRELNPAMIFNFEEYGTHRDSFYDMGHASHSHSDPTKHNSQSGCCGCGCNAGHAKEKTDTCSEQGGRASVKHLYKRHEEAEDSGVCLSHDGDESTCSHKLGIGKRGEQHKKASGLERLLGGMFPKGNPALSSLLGTLYISLFPNLILFATPSSIPSKVLRIMVAFAVGGLLGDVFLHLMPHMFAAEDDHHGRDHSHGSDHASHGHTEAVDVHTRNTVYGCTVFLGLMVFFLVDKFMRLLGGDEHSHSHSHSHGHGDHAHKHLKTSSSSSDASDPESRTRLRKRHNGARKSRRMVSDANEADDEKEMLAEISAAAAKGGEKKPIKMSAYLNLVADATHNFTDGLAMSASFYLSHAAGLSTFVAVFFHEIPHELGDFAILVQSGFSRTSALASQFFTALGAIAGTCAGILIEEAGRGNSINIRGLFTAGVPVFAPAKASAMESGVSGGLLASMLGGILGLLPSSVAGVPWGKLVIPFTAGGFIYVGTVSVLSDLLQPDEEDLVATIPTGKSRAEMRLAEKLRTKRGVYMALVEIAAMLIGLGIMAVIALGEE
ncbi:hypothetical protein EV177_002570 [Coemansia sp. RSA 1804]|nr:hypothetical protein EV177_002570 [Coemansia sp. RSA 1804]